MKGISSLSKDFAISPVYFELEDATPIIGDDIDSIIILLLSTQEYGLYLLVSFLFASILFHYDDPNRRLSPSNMLRASTAFTEASNDIGKYATVK